jgi:hypothetical protein
LRTVLAEAAEELATLRSRERRKIWLIRRIRSCALEWEGENPAGEENPLFRRIAALPEPDRSALALFHCFEGNMEDLAETLELKAAAFVQKLAEARRALAPETVFPENALLWEHRPWGGDRSKVAKAVRKAGPELAAQAALDSQWHEAIKEMAVPEEMILLSQTVPPRPGLRSLLFQPAVLAIVLALVVVVGVLIYITETRLGDFPGKEEVVALVEDAETSTDPDFESLSPTEAGKLDDWFVLKGFAGYNVPPQLEKAKAIGGRVFRHEGALLADVELETPTARLLVFHLADIKTELEQGRWRIFQQDDWAVAVMRDEENGYIVMFQGDSDDMPGFLSAEGK